MRKLAILLLTVTVFVFFTANSYTFALGMSDSSIKGIRHIQSGEVEEIIISVGNYRDYSTFTLSNPSRIVIDLSGASAPGRQQKINIGSTLIRCVRYAQFKDGVARIVLDVEGQLKYKIDEKPGYIKVYVSRTGNFSHSSPNITDRGGDERKKMSVRASFDIEYIPKGSREEIVISMDSYEGYNVFTLLDPVRIVIDIPDAKAPGRQQKIDIDSEVIEAIRYAQYNKDTARIVLDLKKNYGFEIEEKEGQMVLSIENPAYENITLNNGNITYCNKGDRVYVILDGVKLTEGGEVLKKLYTEKYNSRKRTYTITFSSKLGEVKSDEMKINDSKFESIEVVKDKRKGKTSIIFNAKDDFVYMPFTREDVNNTAITVLKPASKSDRLVVIDPGHGGVEPGAIYGNLYEKDLNLDIALRLNQLLRKNGINTYMIRQDDSFVALYERAYIANNLNAALFLSIHNNAMADPGYSGTMTLCYGRSYGSGLNGYKFATIIQKHLVRKLGTVDRKVIERPKLVVLKGTVMPAALAEIAFMTNTSDRKNLQNESFRQEAADALYEAVVEALKVMD